MARIDDNWLALSHWTPIVRYVAGLRSVPKGEISGSLRILGLLGAPQASHGNSELNLAKEQELLETAISRTNKVQIEWLMGKDISENLQDRLRNWQPHVIHYIGHSTYDSFGSSTGLLLENSGQKVTTLSSTKLGVLLRDSTVQFAFLNACHTGHSLNSIAQHIVKTCLPAAIGMQGDIPDSIAIEFSSAFYQALSDLLSIETALAEGRKRIFTVLGADDFQWTLPVLFMQTDNGYLFRQASRSIQ